MNNELIALTALRFRELKPAQLEMLKEKIETHGWWSWCALLVVKLQDAERYYVIDGHHRLQLLRDLKQKYAMLLLHHI